MSTDYWVDLIRETVRYRDACRTAYNNGSRTYLEIGAHPVQSALLLQNVGEMSGKNTAECFSTLRKEHDDWLTAMRTFVKFYVMGYPVNFCALYYPYSTRKVPVPVDRRSFILLGKKSPQLCGIDLCQVSSVPRPVISKFILNLLGKALINAGKEDLVKNGLRDDQIFRDIGIDSLQLVIIKNQFQEMLGPTIALKFSDILDCRTTAELTDKICEAVDAQLVGEEEVARMNQEQITQLQNQAKKDMVVPLHIKGAGEDNPAERLADIKVFLVLGATGNLGPFLIEWLCQRKGTEKMYCLVRGKNGKERLRQRFEELGLLENIDMNKIFAVEGDITEERFGLKPSAYDDLGDAVDAIINSAASTNHLAKYRVDDSITNGPRHVNVFGAFIIKFIVKFKIK
jgi:hypothetical protein